MNRSSTETRAPVGRLRGVLALFLSAAWSLGIAGGTGAESLQNFLQDLNSLQASFRQWTLSADGGRILESEGTLSLKRPGRLRWEYRTPAEQIIIADGDRVWMRDLALDQISHQDQKTALEGTPAQILIEDGPIERYFRILPWDGGDSRSWVELQPKADGQIVRIRIGFLKGKLDTLLMEDRFGQITRFQFWNLQRNPRLSDALFQMDLPTGGEFLDMP